MTLCLSLGIVVGGTVVSIALLFNKLRVKHNQKAKILQASEKKER